MARTGGGELLEGTCSVFSRKPRHIKVMEVERLKTFSDSIFAFAMTLLITRITLPDVPVEQAAEQMPVMVLSQWRHFEMYAISFLGIGGYWVLHHIIFDAIRHTDRMMIWLNLLFLLTVTFLPLPTGLMGKYGRDSFTAAMYGVTISLNYALLLVVCWYACSDDLYLKPGVDPLTRRLLRFRVALPLVVALIGTALSFFFYRLSFLFYFLVLVVNSWPLASLAKHMHMITASEADALSLG